MHFWLDMQTIKSATLFYRIFLEEFVLLSSAKYTIDESDIQWPQKWFQAQRLFSANLHFLVHLFEHKVQVF